MPEKEFFEHILKLSPRSEPAGIDFPAKLAYYAIGDSSKPAVLLPTCFGGKLETTTPWLYEGLNGQPPVLPSSDYFVIVTGLLGGSESSSPSNQDAPYHGHKFPHMTYEDSIRLQKALCDHLGVKKLFAYIGFSMGGQQAYHMVTLFPTFVERMVCLAGSAKTSAHNWSFLEGPKTALMSSVDFQDGAYPASAPAKVGVRAFKRVYSTWALCQQWFREKQWETLGYKTLDDYLEDIWGGKEGSDANDLLALTWTWQHGDITVYDPEDKGDLEATLKKIRTRCLIMPSRTDMYFPPEDSEVEVKYMPEAKLSVIESIWGHLAGGGAGTQEDKAFISSEIKAFFES